jgi:HJR/Mrr/RecB family endonuclease
LLYKDGKKIVVQCKAHRNPVGPNVVRELYGTMFHAGADAAKLVALGGFTQGV